MHITLAMFVYEMEKLNYYFFLVESNAIQNDDTVYELSFATESIFVSFYVRKIKLMALLRKTTVLPEIGKASPTGS